MADDDIGDVLGEVSTLMKRLEARRDDLVKAREVVESKICELQGRLEEFDEAIAKVNGVLGPMKQVPQPRNSGVKSLAEDVVRALAGLVASRRNVELHTIWISQEDVIEEACRRDSDQKPHSLVSSLGRLVREEVLERRGKRGSHEYRMRLSGAQDGQSTAPVVDAREIILGKLKDAGDEGCTEKQLAWAVGDGADIAEPLRELVAAHDVKIIHPKSQGEEVRYLLAPRVAQPRSLFPGADDPEQPAAGS